MRLLLVEDDPSLGKALEKGLKQMQFTVDWVTDGILAENALTVEHFDLVILDLGLPKKSGTEVLESLRAQKNSTPVLILSARDGIHDRIESLNLGANYYMQKPFDLDELKATIHAIHRTTNRRTNTQITLGPLKLDPSSHQASLNDVVINLSRREFTLLHKLIEIPNRVLSREYINQILYGWSDDIDSNTIEVHIHNLRKKLKDNIQIQTIRGVGYRTKAIECND
ncbi:MAG TPA: response regulator transcription factor [Gammaproteobacteria bacterium]|nr:response regulator transcription factor [Gammaproteobacteria bacterium]